MSGINPGQITVMAVFPKKLPCTSITPPGEWDVMAHVLRHYTYARQHPDPVDYYNERCIQWLERSWRNEMLHGWRPYSRQNDHTDHQVLEQAKNMVDDFYQDWDCDSKPFRR